MCVSGSDSDSLPFTYGVPKGSLLGTLLFLLYVNDLYNTSNLLTGKNLDDLQLKLS